MIINNIKTQIIEYFFINPTKKLRVREISRLTKSPLPSAIRYVKELVNEELLRMESVGSITLYSANRSSKKYLLQKKLYNIETLYKRGLVDAFQACNARALILFGSYSKGEDIETSDVDIYVEAKIIPPTERLEKLINRKIQIFNYASISSVKNKELANNIINGIILAGNIEVFK